MSPKAPKGKISISGPFDARHVSGVSIPGVTNPIPGIQRSNTTTSSIQPDSIPTHSFAATGTEEITRPKRANTIAHTLSRPSVRLKTSISRLRTRSHSNSPDPHRKRDETVETVPEAEEDSVNAQTDAVDMSTASLRQKPSMSRLRERARTNPVEQARRERDVIPEAVMSVMPTPLEKPMPVVTGKQLPPLRLRESSRERNEVKTTMVDLPDHSHRNLPQVLPRVQKPQPQLQPQRLPPSIQEQQPSLKANRTIVAPLDRSHRNLPVQQSQSHLQSREATSQVQPKVHQGPPALPMKPLPARAQVVTRPKRADSGTAIDFSDAPAQGRPLGFKEILAVSSLEQRMALYTKTRKYWATADHGLDEWVWKAGTGPRRPVYTHA